MSASEPKWSRLDNAAKIFPSTSSKKDPKVFRFSCELTEPVDGQTLQFALDQTMEKFPFTAPYSNGGYFGIISRTAPADLLSSRRDFLPARRFTARTEKDF